MRDFSLKSEVNWLPKVPQSDPRGPNGTPMASQGHPKILELAAFFREVVQGWSRGAIWEHSGSILGAFREHVLC